MKIFDTATVREADAITIERQGITSVDLMERAGKEVFMWLKSRFPDKETVFHIYCGKGNNGGDGLVVARLLVADSYRVHLEIIEIDALTGDAAIQLQKIAEAEIPYNEEAPATNAQLVIVDAIFGSGLSREPEGKYAEAIAKINHSKAFVVSIDVPSGLFMESHSGLVVEADVVLTFQLTKLALYLTGNYKYCKDVKVLDIGLDKAFIDLTPTNYNYIDKFDAHSRYRPLSHFAHKGNQGHALIIGGSYGKTGAVQLSAKAALKSGCGLITAYVPECGYTAMQSAFPEAMVLTNGERHIMSISFDLQPTVIGIGPGLGQHEDTQQALYEFLKLQQVPIVVDADALNILSYNKGWLELLPEDSVITPHPKELQPLIGEWKDDFEKLEKIKAFSSAHNLVVVAKEAHTMVFYKNVVYVNSTGNASLATAGSGDVLTGIITGLIAQGYTTVDAAVFGVYLHGLTADIAVEDTGMQAFTATTILEYLGKAYLKIEADVS
ncbi:MAG: NAD(P)H-hydrate dehydratase [Flavobacterium sp.]|nr:MAG: NAD(P)H-hydrate dehydratase [Flavobacterium sp.]